MSSRSATFVMHLFPRLGRYFEAARYHHDALLKAPPLPMHQRPGAHADPVVIVTGLADTAVGAQNMADALRRDGFRVFTPEVPGAGTERVAAQAQFLASYVDSVRAATGATHVDLVGNSEGGLVIRYYEKFLGGVPHTGRVVNLHSPNHGVTGLWGPKGYALIHKIPLVGPWVCATVAPAALDIFAGSALLRRLNAGDETPGDIPYTSIMSPDYDGQVAPASSRLAGATNIEIGQGHHLLGLMRGPGHVAAFHDSIATYEAVRSALLVPTPPRAHAPTQ